MYDLGSGGGIDVLLSARRVGPDGFAYGVDVSDQATLAASDGAKLNLSQRNMIAVRAECEVGFSLRDPDGSV